MKALVIGCGNIGQEAAADLARSTDSLDIVVADKNPEKAQTTAERIHKDNVSWVQLDTVNRNALPKTLHDFDVALGFLPGNLGYNLMEACINAGTDLVDVSFMAENPLALTKKAQEAGVIIVPDCGLAPGISNFLVGHALSMLDTVEKVHMMVGGLPEKPIPPLGYVITWSPDSLIDEYTRKARIITDGKMAEVEALSGTEHIDFPSVGKLEAFYTDGLRTLLDTVKGAEEMWEKTLRYPGHAASITLLRDLGFFEDKPLAIDGNEVAPRKLTSRLLGLKLWRPEVGDIVALKVMVSGVKDGKKASHAYHLLDRHDKERGVTAMARTTAYPASIAAQLILKKVITEKGVLPPEVLGKNKDVYGAFIGELQKRNIRVVEE